MGKMFSSCFGADNFLKLSSFNQPTQQSSTTFLHQSAASAFKGTKGSWKMAGGKKATPDLQFQLLLFTSPSCISVFFQQHETTWKLKNGLFLRPLKDIPYFYFVERNTAAIVGMKNQKEKKWEVVRRKQKHNWQKEEKSRSKRSSVIQLLFKTSFASRKTNRTMILMTVVSWILL